MAISDDTLRNLAGERDRLTKSPAIDARRVMPDVSQVSEIAAELLRHRAAERADRERVRQVVEEISNQAIPAGLSERDRGMLESFAGLVSVRVAKQFATAALPDPPSPTAPLPDIDRQIIERWWVRWAAHRPSVAGAVHRLLNGTDLTNEDRDELVLFASHCNDRWPVTCAAVARVLDGLP